MTSAYLFKHFNFLSVYDSIFSIFSYYTSLCINASKHLKIVHKRFLKYASKANTNIFFNKILIT